MEDSTKKISLNKQQKIKLDTELLFPEFSSDEELEDNPKNKVF